MSDGGRERASIGVGVWKSSQKWSAQRSAVRSIAWLDLFVFMPKCRNNVRVSQQHDQKKGHCRKRDNETCNRNLIVQLAEGLRLLANGRNACDEESENDA